MCSVLVECKVQGVSKLSTPSPAHFPAPTSPHVMASPPQDSSAKPPSEVSIVMPVHNGAKWLEESLSSILGQTFTGSMQLSVFNDASTDSSVEILESWREKFKEKNITMVIGGHDGQPGGTGFGRNQAIRQSTGRFLCFFDADDVMTPDRVECQYTAAVTAPDTLVGSCYTRTPAGSTERYTRWCNTLTPAQLHTQAFTAFGPTLIQPTWFCSRELFDKLGPFSEQGRGTPEDLMFFYKHLSCGGQLLKIERPLLVYRYHQDCESFNVNRRTIWDLRVEMIQEAVLSRWSHFTIWNAGKQGRRFYRSLHPDNQAKVTAFCDVDHRKISQGTYIYEESKTEPKPRIPIVHFSKARPPFILCVKWDLTGGGFEQNLASLNLQEGADYYHFS